jgi:hypothetical protein
LVLAALGVFVVRLIRLRKRSKAERAGLVNTKLGPLAADERRRVAVSGFLVFAILFPPLYAIAKRSPLYDGLRHFLFLVPMFAVVAGVSLAKLGRMVAARSRPAAGGFAGLIAAYCLRMIVMMVHLHPHQYLGFNGFIGGLPGAFLRYDTDYYGNTYKEAFETLRAHLWRTERERYLAGPYVVSACMPPFIAREYLGTNFELDESGGPPAEFWLGYTRNNCYLKHSDHAELTRVEREGTLLNLIRDLRSDEQRGRVSVTRPPQEHSGARRPKSKSKSKPKPKSKSAPRKPAHEELEPR